MSRHSHKRIWSAASAIVAAGGVFAACGGGSSGGATPPAEASTGGEGGSASLGGAAGASSGSAGATTNLGGAAGHATGGAGHAGTAGGAGASGGAGKAGSAGSAGHAGNAGPTTCVDAHGSVGCCAPDGSAVYYFANGMVQTSDCAGTQMCGWDKTNGFYACLKGGASDPSGANPDACGGEAPGSTTCDSSSGGGAGAGGAGAGGTGGQSGHAGEAGAAGMGGSAGNGGAAGASGTSGGAGVGGGVGCPAPAVVISQVFGGGGIAGAAYWSDFVELFNRSSSPVTLDGWSIQYASVASQNFAAVTPLTGTIAPGGYFLVGEAMMPGAMGQPLPAADVMGVINLSSTSGIVALVNNVTSLGTMCPSASGAVDLIGYGSSPCFEGTAAPMLSGSAAAVRIESGCGDTSQNGHDFAAASPTPRNSKSPTHACSSCN